MKGQGNQANKQRFSKHSISKIPNTKRNCNQQRFNSEVHRAMGTIHKYFQIPHKAIQLNNTPV